MSGKKKVAILTTHRANNFGAMLQAYSLVQACRELGADAEILDWRSPHFEWQYHSAWRMYRNPIPALRHWWWYMTVEPPTRRLFAAFRSALPLSRPIYNRAGLRSCEVDYDAFIVGSDQVWNPLNSGITAQNFDRAYLLNFVRAKPRFAYAASMGTRELSPVSIVPEFVNEWNRFGLISMREREGSDYVSKMIGRNVETAVDPVLLHDADWWMGAIEKVNCACLPKRFVFKYNVRIVDELERFAARKSRDLSAAIVTPLMPSFHSVDSSSASCLGPLEFVAAIQRAECVIGSSFHAAAFSLIFRKRLYLIQRNNVQDPNTRFSELLRITGINEEVVERSASSTITLIDFSKTDRVRFANAQKRSWDLLRQML